MSEDHNKENIADGLFESVGANVSSSTSRRKDKSRSASMGPVSNVQQLKEQKMNRRKSMMPTVKSILSATKEGKSNEDEVAKRKAARRKSLANRRVSFAPEATLHTWDVIEYMRDATSSSASSEEARRASTISQVESQTSMTSFSAAGSSETAILSADTTSTSSAAATNQVETQSENESTDDEDEMGDATMELDEATRQTLSGSGDLTSSSSKLDDALRQATAAARANTFDLRTAGNDDEADDDQTMDLVRDEVTSAFQPWFNRNRNEFVNKKSTAADDQENIGSFEVNTGAIPTNEQSSDEESNDDATMDVTVAFGGIIQQTSNDATPKDLANNTKRRRSSVNLAAQTSGSPVSRSNTRRSLDRRRSSIESMIPEDQTMDFTMAVGGIQKLNAADVHKDMTEMSIMDATMDFTVAVGHIQSFSEQQSAVDITEVMPNTEVLEDLSMELTANLGKTIAEAINTIAPSPTKTDLTFTNPLLVAIDAIERSDTPVDADATVITPKNSIKQSLRSSSRNSLPQLVASPKTINTPTTTRQVNKLATPEVILTPLHSATIDAQPDHNTTGKSSIANGLKMLATPRKEILPTPIAPVMLQATPKRSTPGKGQTPRKRAAETTQRASPQKRVRMEVDEQLSSKRAITLAEDDQEVDAISLPDFLSMTGIRFMDLTTTKRRATGFPGADGAILRSVDSHIDELEASMENKVVAAVATQPMLQMYQHSCTEMKSYIASGRTEIKSIEVSAIEDQPPLFHDYANATFAEKMIIDNQLRDLKTNARLQSKSSWHTWRSQLLNDLRKGLTQTAEDLLQDEKLLEPLETRFAELVPATVQQEEGLQTMLRSLQQRKSDVDNGVEADLEHARKRLASIQEESRRKQLIVESHRHEAKENRIALEDARSWKAETLGAITEADRISEECRGWSTKEVITLNDKISLLEDESGWKLCSAGVDSISLKSKDLLVTVDPRSWLLKANQTLSETTNTSISITCNTEVDADDTAPVATIQRFFLQYIRAQAYTLPQSCTRIAHLLTLVQNGWSLASRILLAVRSLEISGNTVVQILSDEKLGIQAFMFLPMLQTKVRVEFQVSITTHADDARVNGMVDVAAHVVYGERYDEPKMASFLQQFVASGQVGSEDEVQKWAHGFDDLRDRLIRTGRKGVRRV